MNLNNYNYSNNNLYKRDYKEDFNYMKYKNQLNDDSNNKIRSLQDSNKIYSYGPEQRSINIKPNVVEIDSKKSPLNQFQQNEMSFNKNYNIVNNSESFNYNYKLGPDPNNEAQMNYLKNLLEKTKSEIDQLNNNMDEDGSKAFNIYK